MYDFEKLKQEIKSNFEKELKNWCIAQNVEYVEQGENRKALESKYSEWVKAEMEKAELEEKQKAIAKKFEFSWSKVPTRYKNASVSDLRQTEFLKSVLSGSNALILGANGTGKTHMAYSVMREWLLKGETVQIFKALELLSQIKSEENPYRFIAMNYKNNIKHLIIDEIDKIFESKADFVYLNYLIDMRYEWELQTIVIGNGTKEGFLSSIGQSVFRRLTTDGGAFVEIQEKKKKENEK